MLKKVPVKGFVLHSKESDSEHSHGLYITSWDGRPITHEHAFAGVTSFDDGHVHQYVGTTQPAPTGVPHIHQYYTVTSLNNGHTHIIQGVTGPAIDLPSGGHIHYFEGYTTVSGMNPHTHHYKGTTGNEI